MSQRSLRLGIPCLDVDLRPAIQFPTLAQRIMHGDVSTIRGSIDFSANHRLVESHWHSGFIQQLLFGQPLPWIDSDRKHSPGGSFEQSLRWERRQCGRDYFFPAERIENEVISFLAALSGHLKISSIGR